MKFPPDPSEPALHQIEDLTFWAGVGFGGTMAGIAIIVAFTLIKLQ